MRFASISLFLTMEAQVGSARAAAHNGLKSPMVSSDPSFHHSPLLHRLMALFAAISGYRLLGVPDTGANITSSILATGTSSQVG